MYLAKCESTQGICLVQKHSVYMQVSTKLFSVKWTLSKMQPFFMLVKLPSKVCISCLPRSPAQSEYNILLYIELNAQSILIIQKLIYMYWHTHNEITMG